MSIKPGMWLLFAGCLFTAAISTVPALAQDDAPAQESAQQAAPGAALPTPVIAVVDVDQIMQESSAAKGVRGQRDRYQQSFQTEISQEESALRATKQDLDQQHDKMDQAAFAEKARAFDQSVAEFERKVVARRRALDKSFAQAMSQVEQSMIEVTAQVGGAHGANVVLPRSQVILFSDKMNITKEIITALNQKLPAVDFPAPKVEAEAAAMSSNGSKKK